jgi:hypothetical protein
MPKLTIGVTGQDWEALRDWAEREQISEETLAAAAVRCWLQVKRLRGDFSGGSVALREQAQRAGAIMNEVFARDHDSC